MTRSALPLIDRQTHNIPVQKRLASLLAARRLIPGLSSQMHGLDSRGPFLVSVSTLSHAQQVRSCHGSVGVGHVGVSDEESSQAMLLWYDE